jgi:hypothetical protein
VNFGVMEVILELWVLVPLPMSFKTVLKIRETRREKLYERVKISIYNISLYSGC